MKNNDPFTKGIFTAVAAWFGKAMGLLFPTLALLLLLMAAEYISSMLVARKEAFEHPENQRSKHIRRKIISSLYRKAGCILTISAALSLDYLIHKYAARLGIQADNDTLFGLLVTIWFILSEVLAILKNTRRLGAALPEFLVKAIKKIKDYIDNTKL